MPWQILLVACVLSALRFKYERRPSARVVVLLAAALSVVQVVWELYPGLRNRRLDDATPDYVTAEGLTKMGIRPGANVAVIGFGNDGYFAYLGGLSIVAEIERKSACEFWQAPRNTQSNVMEKLRQSGAQAIVANTGSQVQSTAESMRIDVASCAHPGGGWRQIEGSENHVYFLQ
jgi:hypothetical protein